MFSNQSKYALRGVIYLAIHASKQNKLGSKEVGENINVPIPFLAKIFQALSREGIIHSTKGPHGGFYLDKNDLQGNLMSVVECIDGASAFSSCFIGLPQCSDDNPCAIHDLAAPLRNQLILQLKNRSIEEFAEDIKNGKSFIF